LTIPPAGDAELLLLQPLASKPSPLGRFRGPIAPGTRAALERLVADHDLLDADQGEWATAEGSGSISLATPERRVLLGLASADPARNELRAKLDRVVDELTAHPVGAFRTELGAEPAPGGLVPILSLVHVGSEPLALVLVERDMVVSVVATVKPPNGPARELVLEPERVRDHPALPGPAHRPSTGLRRRGRVSHLGARNLLVPRRGSVSTLRRTAGGG
jgi:hypothetical protein